VTEVAFYHLQRSPLEKALPKLLEKTLAAGQRAVVMAASAERIEALNALLWTYHQDSWLPHGSARDGNPAEQPIWLTVDDENPNGAGFLFLTDGATSARVADYERLFELFDGNDPTAVEAARRRWSAYKDAGHDLTYWQQTDGGGWQEKAQEASGNR
jgi:DNA polymerase-3 subunit chi